MSTEPARIAVHNLHGDLTATTTSFSSKTLDPDSGLIAPEKHLSMPDADTASQNTLTILGLNATVQPVNDVKMFVNWNSQISSLGIFARVRATCGGPWKTLWRDPCPC